MSLPCRSTPCTNQCSSGTNLYYPSTTGCPLLQLSHFPVNFSSLQASKFPKRDCSPKMKRVNTAPREAAGHVLRSVRVAPCGRRMSDYVPSRASTNTCTYYVKASVTSDTRIDWRLFFFKEVRHLISSDCRYYSVIQC